MTPDAVSAGWAVAGVLLVGSGLGLCVRAKVQVSGGLFVLTGTLFIAVCFPVGILDAPYAGVAAMAALTAAIATYPRAALDLTNVLTLTAVLLGAPVLAWQLGGADGLSAGDVSWIAFALVMVGASQVWWRLETASAEVRGSLLWVLSTSGIALFLIGVVALAGTPAGLAAVVHASVGMIGIAALLGADSTGRLDGRWVASRAAAVSFTVACLFACANLLFAVIEWFSGSAPGVAALAIATVACGALWHPVLKAMQMVSDGALFGIRPDALTAVQRVAVSISDDPVAAVRAIQAGLVLPYAALTLSGQDQIAFGTPTHLRRSFPIRSGDEDVGELVVGIRPGDSALTHDDERVLALALPLLGQTIRARAQAASLQRAREASASAREEERRRLRRDLHDGLGPRLTGIAFTADAAKLASRDDAASPMLDRIRHEAETAINEIREVVYGLRPPALDELGLLAAISLKAEAFPEISIDVETNGLPGLPAAVEVAAYRIVLEALTNVARHSGATQARVRLLTSDGTLTIEIWDNGAVRGEWGLGIGLTSMRERASELGGELRFGSTPTGSVVAADLPLGTSGRAGAEATPA